MYKRMSDTKNIFISHVHEDEALLRSLKQLISRAGMQVRDGSVTSEKPNNATSEAYIRCEILRPRIQWASVLIVLINHDTADSDWVNWEITEAVEQGKPVVGVYAQGATEADLPEALRLCGDAAIVAWRGDQIVAAIRGELHGGEAWEDPRSGEPREPEWLLKRHTCK